MSSGSSACSQLLFPLHETNSDGLSQRKDGLISLICLRLKRKIIHPILLSVNSPKNKIHALFSLGALVLRILVYENGIPGEKHHEC